VSPDVLDQILPQIGRSKTTDDSANERPDTTDKGALSNAIPHQDLSQEAPIFLGI
jgi:hypothetical protein